VRNDLQSQILIKFNILTLAETHPTNSSTHLSVLRRRGGGQGQGGMGRGGGELGLDGLDMGWGWLGHGGQVWGALGRGRGELGLGGMGTGWAGQRSRWYAHTNDC